MARKYGKLRDTKGVIDTSDQTPQLSVPGSEIVEIEEESWASIIFRWSKGIIAFFLSAIVIIALLFTIMACSLMVFSPVEKEGQIFDRTLVVRGTWADTGGIPPVGTEVVVSNNQYAPTDKWWDWALIGWHGIPNPSRVEIATTNYDKLYISGTVEQLEDEKVNYEATVTSVNNPEVTGEFFQSPALDLKKFKKDATFEFNHTLDEQYLVKCISGKCEPGTFFVVDKGQIFGEVK